MLKTDENCGVGEGVHGSSVPSVKFLYKSKSTLGAKNKQQNN